MKNPYQAQNEEKKRSIHPSFPFQLRRITRLLLRLFAKFWRIFSNFQSIPLPLQLQETELLALINYCANRLERESKHPPPPRPPPLHLSAPRLRHHCWHDYSIPPCNRPIKRNSALMFVVPFGNPNASPNLNPNLNSEPNANPGTDPGFGTEDRLNRVEGAGLEVREQPLSRPDRDYGNGLSMGRRKKYSPMNPNSSGKTEQCCWTTAMDEALIDAFVCQESLGNRASTGTFTSQAYDNIMRDLRDKFRDRPLDKERIKNRIKYIKKNFAPCYDIFKNGLEGFSWNPATKLWTAEPEDWDRLIEAHPEAVEWMSKPVPHYDKLSLLYRPDREVLDYVEKRRRDNSIGENQVEGAEVMDGVTFEGLDGLNQLEGESCSSKKRARKVNKDQANAMILREGLDKIAEAITKSTAELVKLRQRLPIPEGQMWDLLVELGFEESVISTVYIFLIERPHMVGALLGCPPHRRKDVLIQMAFGSSSSVPPPK